MKNRLLIIVAALSVTLMAVAQKTRVVENPVFESANTSSIEFTRIEVNKEATVVSAIIWQRHNYWVKINSSSVLKGCTTGREYKLLRVEGVEADKELWMPANNRLDCTLYFEPVSGEDVSVDFTENLDAGQNPWEIKGISLQPALGFLQGSWEPVEDAGNVVAAFMRNRLLYDGEVWKYTAVPKGKNITLDITCGGVTRQLIAVQKGNGNILLKKDKKDKGTLLTRKAQPTGDDGYTYNPSTATPLFFRHGKVVLKGCVINNNTGAEQQKLMKILKYNNALSFSGNELVTINRDGSFQCEFEIDYPHYVYMQSPLNTMVFVVPGDTVVMCYDTVESNREYYTNRAPAVLGNSLSAQITRYSMPCRNIIGNGIEGLNEYTTFNKSHSATQESALAFVGKAAPLFEEIYGKAPSLLAGLPLSPVAKDIIITNVVEELFTNVLDVDMYFENENGYIKNEGAWTPKEDFVPLLKMGYYSFLNDSTNIRNILNNSYLLCNRNNWVVFNRFAFGIVSNFANPIYMDRNANMEKLPSIKELSALPENRDNEDFKNAVAFLNYGNHYTGEYNAKVVEIARNIPFGSLPTNNYIYGQTFDEIEKELGFGNCVMLQQAIMEFTSLKENDLGTTMELMAGVMPFITNPVVAGQLANGLRRIVAEREGGIEKKMRPEVAHFLESLNKKYPGEVIILDFWGLGCGPCRSAMLAHRELVEKYAGKVRFVYICDAANPEAAVNEFFTTNNIKGENMRVSADTWAYLSSHFNFSGIPHMEILLKDGTLYKSSDGFHLNDSFIENSLLKE